MKVTTPNLRTEILLTLLFLLLIGMGLISIVTIKIAEGNLVQYPKNLGLSAIQSLQKTIDGTGINSATPLFRNKLKKHLSEQIRRMYLPHLFKKIEVIGKDLTVWASSTGAVSPQTTVPHFSFFFQSKKRDIRINQDTLNIVAPLFLGADCIAAANVEVRIDTVRNTMGKLHVMSLFYIGLNILVLMIIGNFLLTRIVIKPINRLVKLTDQFEDTNVFTLSTSSGLNEISRLAIALNRMLKRLGENKKLLEAQIESLTKANQNLKEAREEVVRSERLASLGRLAAGIAHEIGNPLGAVLGYTNVLIEETKDDESSKDYLKRIEKEIIRIDTIVRELLDFARPSHSEPVKVDLNLIVNETISFFSHQKIANQIELISELHDESLTIWVDSNKIKQVLINLILNAYDAMTEKQGLLNKGEKGWRARLTITTEKASSDHPSLQSYKEKTSGAWALLTISDTGTGIAGSNLEKIFDPFYTTKPPGKGNGLGLAISLRIIESFKGHIYVESTEGEGSTFMIVLPIAGESTR